MAIPDYQTIMLPLLRFAGDSKVQSKSQAVEYLANGFELSQEERKVLLPSGKQGLFDNRVAWAKSYIKQARLIDSPKRGFFVITERGKQVLAGNPKKIDVKYLERFPEFVEFRRSRKEIEKVEQKPAAVVMETNPEEALESAYQDLQETLASELLEAVKQCPPEFFERLVVDVLIKMGYGGSRKEAGRAIGRTGDEGIDGIIKEDKLGLDIIYIQAKRWENTVGRPEIQKFAGALQGQRARKGIFITTSNFTKESLAYGTNIESKIILIDGQRLAELMIEHNVGVSPVASYEVKKIDTDYFIED